MTTMMVMNALERKVSDGGDKGTEAAGGLEGNGSSWNKSASTEKENVSRATRMCAALRDAILSIIFSWCHDLNNGIDFIGPMLFHQELPLWLGKEKLWANGGLGANTEIPGL